MKMMNIFMPIMSAFIAFSVPAGLGLYWIATAVIQTIIQICINRYYDKLGVDEIELNRVQAEVFDGNVASVHVLTKCGMRFEGIARQKYYKKDTFIDTAQYAVLKSDFKE